MARELSNWLEAFVSWSLPRTEAPESMVRWAGLFTLSSVLKRKVLWSEDLLGGYAIYPNLYIVFVGEPAIVRKSTTVGWAQKLLTNPILSGADGIVFADDVTSASKLLAGITSSPDGSLTIVASEFSSLVQLTPESTYEILTDLFDNKPFIKWGTWAHGDRQTDNPVVNLLAATTPAWIRGQPHEYFVGGGWASRIVFVFEEKPSQKEIYYDHLPKEGFVKLQGQLLLDLFEISTLKGEFTFDCKKTKEKMRTWYKKHEPKNDDERMKGYYGRKHLHAHKLAGLLSVSERDDLKVTWAHFEQAINMLTYVEQKMGRAFSTLGNNPFLVLTTIILGFIEDKGAATMKQIAGRVYTEGVNLEQLNSALSFLCASGKIVPSGSVSNKIYTSSVGRVD